MRLGSIKFIASKNCFFNFIQNLKKGKTLCPVVATILDFWLETKKNIHSVKGETEEHSSQVYFLMVQWFQRKRILLIYFPRWPYW